MDEAKGFESWAIVELFGHQQIAGLVTEATIGGCSFVRVDVPETNGRPAFTKFYGNGAIYALTPTGEREARMALERIMPRPVSAYLLPETSRVATRYEDDDEDDDLVEGDPGPEDDYDDEAEEAERWNSYRDQEAAERAEAEDGQPDEDGEIPF